MIDFDFSQWAVLRFIGASFVLWLCYYLLFDRKAPFNQCRSYLLFSVLLAGTVSVLRIPVYPVVEVQSAAIEQVGGMQEPQTSGTSFLGMESNGIQLDTLAATMSDVSEAFLPSMKEEIADEPFYASWNYRQIVWMMYAMGVFVLTMHLLAGMIRIWRLKRWGSSMVDADDICIVRNNEVLSPFSFCRTIFINRKLEGEVLRVVLLHEKGHIWNHHYRDILFIECLSILCWFNPFVWLVKRELRALHEFQVDRYLLSGEIELFEYQSILFEELMGYSPKVANGFHNSLIKKRFIMMKHQYKERLGVVRKVVLLPLCVGLLTLFSFTEKPVVTETELPMVSAQAKVELPEPMMLEEFPDSIADREFVPLPDLPKSDATPMTILPQVKEPFSIQIESKVQPQKVEVADRIGIDLQANQVVLSRASFRKKCFVRFIDRTREDTRVTLAVPIYYDRHWIQFEKGLSILDEDTKDVYRIRSLTRGMEINQTYWIVGHEGQMVEFTLVFPPLDKKVKTITICDCFPEEKGIIPPNGGAWDLAHINIHRLAPTASRQSEYDRDGYPLRPDKLEEVTLPANQLNVSSRQNGGNAQIQRIETLPDKTLVTLNVPIHFNRHWVSIGKGMCLVDSKTGDEYPILGEANGMEMNKLLWIEGCQGGSVFLTLVFPKLPNKVKVIDLYDKYPDAGIVSPKGGISWDWRNIKIKDYRKELYKRIVL